MIANFMQNMGHFSVNPLVASYTKYLGTSAQLTGLLTGMFFAVSLAMRPFAGPVVTKYDKRRLLIIVFVLGIAANLGYALFHNVPAFVAFRFLSGVQYSFLGSLIMTLAGDHLPKEKLASGLGIYGIGGAIGSAIAPSLGETILRLGTNLGGEKFGFTIMFLFGSFVFVIAVIPAFILAPDKKTKEDVAQVGVWYKNILSVHTIPPAIGLFLIMIPYAMVNTYMFEFGKEQGIPNINIFYLVFAATLAVSRPVSGRLTDRFGINSVLFPAIAVFAFSMFFIGASSVLWMVLIGSVLSAIGFGSSQPALQTMCIQSETPVRRGVATNTLYIGIDIGLFLGPYLGGLVYAKSDYPVMFKAGVVPAVLALLCMIITVPIFKRRLNELNK